MPFVAVAPPAPLRLAGPIAAVTIDAQRRRVFAAGAHSVAVIDADTGKLLSVIRIGGARSLALEPLGGHVFAGTRDGHISELDPDRSSVVRTADVAGPVDVLSYNAVLGRLYADGGSRPAVTVLDSRTLASLAAFPFPGGAPGSIASDPVTGELYIENAAQIAVLSPLTGDVRAHFPVAESAGALIRIDVVLGQVAVIGPSGTLDIYDRAGTQRARLAVPPGITGCDVDSMNHVLACTSPAGLTFVQLLRDTAPVLAGTAAMTGSSFATIDTKTHDVLAVRSDGAGAGSYFEHFRATDGRDTHPIP